MIRRPFLFLSVSFLLVAFASPPHAQAEIDPELLVGSEERERVTQERSLGKRARGKVYIDVHQNAFGRPLAAPYTVRAFPQASVSAPLDLSELSANLRPERFNLRTMLRRVEKRRDLWADFWNERQRLEEATERLSAELREGK